ncbi:MAG: MbnP family protein, partial [Mesonia sp.]
LEFDNSMNGDDLILGASAYTNSNGESLTVNRFNYLVSNFVLIDEDGNEFVYPKDDSYFVISEENELNEVVLTNIPAGNYVQLKFGVGVDQEKYQQGAEGQGGFLQIAEENEMMWSWQAGYKFLNFEGTFTSETITEATDFKIHMGSHGSTLDNYREFTVNLPSTAKVSESLTPLIHFAIDGNQILDGDHKILLSEAPVVMVDEVKSPQIAENASTMFMVHHVHNGEGGHH